MPQINCAIVGCSSSTYRINKWKKKNVASNMETKMKLKDNTQTVKGLIVFTASQLIWQKTKREMIGFRLSHEKIETEQNRSQKTVIGFVRLILQMEFQLKQIHWKSCIWVTIQKDKQLDALFSNIHYKQTKHKQNKVK